VTISLKIELLKVFSLELNVSSDKIISSKKEKTNEKESTPSTDTPNKQPSKS
jgi:hypothetical protein